MSSPLAVVLCITLLVICVSGGVLPQISDQPQILDSVKVAIVSKQDGDGIWVNEVKLEHGSEQAPWKVEVEQKTLDRGGRQSVELTATLTGPKPSALQPAYVPQALAKILGSQPLPQPRLLPGSFEENTRENEVQLHSAWRGSQYVVHTAQVDWTTANKTCTEAGAHLAIINSEEEASFLAQMLNRFPEAHRGAFVGITDEAQEGNWVTISGVPIDSAGFARWFRSDQPDNANGNENCGAIYPVNGGFNDVPCTKYLMHWICEKDNEATRNSAALDNIHPFEAQKVLSDVENSYESIDDYDMQMGEELDEINDDFELESNYKQFPGLSSFYKVHTEQMDWETASKTCAEESAHLAIINSEDEARLLAALLNGFYADSSRGAFVGITDEAEEGSWLTIFGESIDQAGFARWFRSDQPDNANGNENCGAIFPSNGGFNDVPCTKYLMHSICEKEDETGREILRSLESDALLSAATPESDEVESETESPEIDESSTFIFPNHMISQSIYDETENDPTTLGYEQHSDLNYYKIHTDADKSWQEAQKMCEMQGGSLAHVDSAEEFRFLVRLIDQSSLLEDDLVFAGFSNVNPESYPDDIDFSAGSDTEACGAIYAGRRGMALVHCQDARPFICEIKKARGFSSEESSFQAVTSEEFDNTVDLFVNSLSKTHESEGSMTVLGYIGLDRGGEMTASMSGAELDYEIDEMQSGSEKNSRASSETEIPDYEYNWQWSDDAYVNVMKTLF